MIKKILHIIGTRPQLVKYYSIHKAILSCDKEYRGKIRNYLLDTGQHYDYEMSKLFFEELSIPKADYSLMVGSGLHGIQTGKMLLGIEKILVSLNPQIVVVYGDTNSTLAGALCASKLGIPVAHVEAGLRSRNKFMVEEVNRIIVDQISTFLFCPSEVAVMNLKNEGFRVQPGNKLLLKNSSSSYAKMKNVYSVNDPLIINCGDVMFDSIIHLRDHHLFKELQIPQRPYLLLTLHRAENTNDSRRFREIISFIDQFSEEYPIIFPMHPRTRQKFLSFVQKQRNIFVTKPVGYLMLLKLLENCEFLMTDSGGMQKEAYWLKKKCITLREETEWDETIKTGYNVLYKNFDGKHKIKKNFINYYGDGLASIRIMKLLFNNLI